MYEPWPGRMPCQLPEQNAHQLFKGSQKKAGRLLVVEMFLRARLIPDNWGADRYLGS